jgi:glycosyltransferase involved in cell wall biosynthesis
MPDCDSGPQLAEIRPLISVGLPVRDAERTVALAITSILRQTYEEWELLILDDRSHDTSKRIANRIAEADSRIRVLDARGSEGLVSRLNQGISAARGELFARMDADDVAYPTRFQRQVEFLLTNPSVDVVGTSMLVFRGEGIARGVRVAPTSHGAICARPNAGFKLFHPTWMGKTEWFRTHGYREYARRWEDQELLCRAWQNSRFANIAEPLVGYREDRVHALSSARTRFRFAAAVMKHRTAERRFGEATAAFFEQMAKAVAETTAAGLGLESLLRHRARQVSPEFISEWREVWSHTRQRACQLNARPALPSPAGHGETRACKHSA